MDGLYSLAALTAGAAFVVALIGSASPRVPSKREHVFHRSFYRPDSAHARPRGFVAMVVNAAFAAADVVDLVRYRVDAKERCVLECVVPWPACAPWRRAAIAHALHAAVRSVHPPALGNRAEVEVRMVWR